MKYLKQFETHAEYEAAKSSLILPNVSICKDTPNEVHYNPYVPETRVVAKFNVTDTSRPTQIGYNQYTSGFSAIEIDGVEQPSVISAYTFSTTGEHTVKYTLVDPTSINDYAFSLCTSITAITLPNSITSIGKGAFNGVYFTSITLPNSVTSIGDDAFVSCNAITSIGPVGSGASVEIPSGVTSIGYNVFQGCYSLTSVTIPNSVTSIGVTAFYDCKFITSVTIPNSVTSIGNAAFDKCSGITRVNISSITAWCDIVFDSRESNPLTFAHHLYLNGEEVRNLIIPDSVTNICEIAFNECSGLTCVTLPKNLTEIPKDCFRKCKITCDIIIPSGITSIGSNAFAWDDEINSITILATTPPTLGNDDVFYSSSYPIYVPSGSVSAYKAASRWNSLASRIQAIP